MCVLIRYPKRMKEGLFYCPQEYKTIVKTTIRLLEKDYLVIHVSRTKLVLPELNKEITNKSIVNSDAQKQLIGMSKMAFNAFK